MKGIESFQIKVKILKKGHFCVRLMDGGNYPEKELFRYFANEIPSVSEAIQKYKNSYFL